MLLFHYVINRPAVDVWSLASYPVWNLFVKENTRSSSMHTIQLFISFPIQHQNQLLFDLLTSSIYMTLSWVTQRLAIWYLCRVLHDWFPLYLQVIAVSLLLDFQHFWVFTNSLSTSLDNLLIGQDWNKCDPCTMHIYIVVENVIKKLNKLPNYNYTKLKNLQLQIQEKLINYNSITNYSWSNSGT